MSSDIDDLMRAATYTTSGPQTGIVLVVDSRTDDGASAPQDVSSVAVEMKRLIDVSTGLQGSAIATPTAAVAAPQNHSTLETVAKTAAMMTGIGPIVTGLLKVFGGGESEPLPPLERFAQPSRVAVEAGLTRDREYTSIRYAQGGVVEGVGRPAASGASPTIQVNVHAMDSQSFVDRQDDIARAVREAMLHSNALNDVVLEL